MKKQHLGFIPTKNEKIAKIVEEAVRFEYNNESIDIVLSSGFYEIQIDENHGFSFAGIHAIAGFCAGYTKALLRYV